MQFVIRNVKQVTGEEIDIVVKEGKINQIVNKGEGIGEKVYDCSGSYVSSGWIDLHVHAFSEFHPYGDEIDEIGYKQGVTTLVDAGSCGADRIADLATRGKVSKTKLFAFLNISKLGLSRVDELSNLDWVDTNKVVQAVTYYSDFIVGLKVRLSRSVVRNNGIEPLRLARKISNDISLPLMVHIGSGPPYIGEILRYLRNGDIITHYLHGKQNNLFKGIDKPSQDLFDAIQRGVCLDVGHGSASFSFKVAEAAKFHKISFNTISTDIYRENRINGPVFSMANVLTKFLYLGYSLREVIEAVTTHAAKWLGKPELGRIRVGDKANLTLFSVLDNTTTLFDSEGEIREAQSRISVRGVVINEEFIEF